MNARYPDAAGHRGVETSIEAAEAIQPMLGRLQRMALTRIIAAGDSGMTAEEVANALQCDRVAIQPRTTELARKGLIRDSERRRNNHSGKRAIVWVARHG